ncbi:MAG: hypothetical protein H6739_24165 [Alphaproteobacteria bacterium]|nr:hypothetical protein [Alphaproteobacteria bacterium]
MALWYTHLFHAQEACRRLGGLDEGHAGWGALCCDVDKFTPVARAVSHLGEEGLGFPPEAFLDRAGLSRARARPARSFLAGYLSHLAVDEAWYATLRATLRPEERPGWGADATRAWNILLDAELVERVEAPVRRFPEDGVEAVLPFLDAQAAGTVRLVGGAYARWPGALDVEPDDPMMIGMVSVFREIVRREEARVRGPLGRLDREALHRGVSDFVCATLRRFLDDLDGG